MNAARVTVATVVLNGAAEIERTLESVLSQDCAALELVVVDGGSRDGTQDRVAAFGASVHHFVSEPDRGIYDGMNKATRIATGEFVLFMNSGDVFAAPDALSRLLAATVPAEEQMVFGGWLRRERRGARLCSPDLEAGAFNHQAVLYSRSLHRRFGEYAVAPGFSAADYLFFATLLASPVRRTVVAATVAEIDVRGRSAGLQTLSQKVAIDFLLGRASRTRLLAVLALHPAYRLAKRSLGR